MKRRTNKQVNSLYLALAAAIFVVGAIFTVVYKSKSSNVAQKPINTMLMLIEFERIEGILQWEKELDKRGLTALVKAQGNIPKEYPDVFKRLADKNYEIAGGYDGEPF